MPTVDAVLAARSVLGNACRSGTPEDITAARDALNQAKADRLRRDADALAGPDSRDELRIMAYASQDRPTRADHRALEDAQYVECREYRTALGKPKDWTEEERAGWENLLSKHTEAHIALGCSQNAPCRMARI